ncbi:SPFH domain-containing protein [Desulfovibrio sp. JC010]|uniref:SPFH domain-containing protein n=1 Tax=Desulfovibrio sp. JC010 TaxID=2593641 RepID=UPI0013D01941|nr:stomatin-like protein [Desulfovibrio sp. JC010]NDV25127.1 paraslipin [Desulfovibrio sp. JC010]
MAPGLIAVIFAALVLIVIIIKSVRIVPQKTEIIVERLGKYRVTLGAGFHFLFPFIDSVAYQFSLKEEALDTLPQTCITSDNVSVVVDGLIFIQVQDAKAAAYGIDNYRYAASQLAQTALRSCVGKLALDKTFEERDSINAQVVEAIDAAAASWGIKVLRYEIKDITPPDSVKAAMETQMIAERQKRADIARSEGEKQATINKAEAAKLDEVLKSEGERERLVNEARGKAGAITMVATAKAKALTVVGETLQTEGGADAASLRVAERYVEAFEGLAKESTTLILPAEAGDVASMVGTAMSVYGKVKGNGGAAKGSKKQEGQGEFGFTLE